LPLARVAVAIDSAAGIAACVAFLLLEDPAAIGEFVQGIGVTAGRADFPAGKTVFAGLEAEEDPAADSPAGDDGAAGASPVAADDADVASAAADASPAAAGEGAAAC
jgi:hypothetical protein